MPTEIAKNLPETIQESPSSFKPTPQQEAIFADVASGVGHTVVVARAGTGKTTTIVKAFDYIPRGESVLMVAFNKEIASELSKRAPSRVQVQTLHSYGLRQLSAALPRRPAIDGDKLDGIVKEATKSYSLPRETMGQFRADLKKAVSLAKGCLSADADEIGDTCDEYQLSANVTSEDGVEVVSREEFLSVAWGVMSQSRENQGTIDFDDMVWMPAIFGICPTTYSRVFVDEAQDLNRAQMRLTKKAISSRGRICAVGDDRQAIYAFRGAAADAIPSLISSLEAKRLGLTVTYRCGKAIVELAKKIVPDFSAAESTGAGRVSENVSKALMVKSAQPGDFILSRTNAPLVQLCFTFLRSGRKVAIRGRDIGAKLRSTVTRTKATSVTEMLQKIEQWGARECKRLAELEKEVVDTVECIRAVAEECDTVDEVLTRLDSLFTADDKAPAGGQIILSSTHRAKGLESDRVWMLRDTYLKGRRREDGEGGFYYEPPSIEEENLYYVAVTRAKKELYMVREIREKA